MMLYSNRYRDPIMPLSAPELELIYRTAPIGLAFLTTDCRYVAINERLTEICGISISDHIGRSVRETVPQVAEQVEHIVQTILRTGDSIIGVEVHGQRPDGSNIDRVWITHWHPLKDQFGNITGINVAAEEITERRRAEEHQKVLMAELDHRVKNVLARVTAIAQSAYQGGGSIDDFLRSYNGRIQSMALAHTLLSHTGWRGANLTAIVRNQLAPYATDTNMTIAGSDVVLTASAIQALAMVLHELVTNAVKYGALSSPAGRVSVSWDCKVNGNATTNLIFLWRELNGPPVAAGIRSGYGTGLIRELIPHELDGNVYLEFASDGVCCRIEFPIEK